MVRVIACGDERLDIGDSFRFVFGIGYAEPIRRGRADTAGRFTRFNERIDRCRDIKFRFWVAAVFFQERREKLPEIIHRFWTEAPHIHGDNII